MHCRPARKIECKIVRSSCRPLDSGGKDSVYCRKLYLRLRFMRVMGGECEVPRACCNLPRACANLYPYQFEWRCGYFRQQPAFSRYVYPVAACCFRVDTTLCTGLPCIPYFQRRPVLCPRRAAFSGHCVLSHDAHPPLRLPRTKHRSRRTSNAATARPMAQTI